jgi:hypothetical protein
MKKLIFNLALMFLTCHLFGQDLKSIDSTLKNIDDNVGQLKEELVKEEVEPYTGQSIFEDRKGSSAIFLPYGGTFKLNTTDASLNFSFTNYQVPIKDESGKYKLKPFYGVEINGKTNDGILSLISNGNISPGAKVNGILGKDVFNITKDKNGNERKQVLGTLALRIGYEGSSFKLFNSDSVFAKQINKVSFNTFSSTVSFNVKFGGNKILAISTGYKKVNNYGDLDEIELSDKKIITDSVSNTTRTYEVKKKVRVGDYKTFDQIPINLDFFWTPNNNPRIGFYHFWRTKFTNGAATNGFGSGLYLLKKNNPLASIAGIVFEVDDISKLNDGYSKNFTINFVVGYNFGFTKRK